ncbi:MAG: TPM domain-containing protein [Moraxella sp.]|uniref:TPM domain-containing protein n=1 Tax=Moraxella sp. TaxID=479 RepID=UPI0026DD4856|nr:TPM domain-containing protein [Moraxella sp.]MDO4450941.1 TPM domain-containing protein [Moraxella sp.]
MTNTSPKSFARLVRQMMFVPFLHNRWLDDGVKIRLARAITNAENGHAGEIVLIIENHLPINMAYTAGCRERALRLFAEHGVWDTEHNTGVLIYVNLCEHGLEIIADRGIDAHACDEWQSLCQNTLDDFKKGDMEQGLKRLIGEVGRLLNSYFPSDDVMGDELSNQVIYLR